MKNKNILRRIILLYRLISNVVKTSKFHLK